MEKKRFEHPFLHGQTDAFKVLSIGGNGKNQVSKFPSFVLSVTRCTHKNEQTSIVYITTNNILTCMIKFQLVMSTLVSILIVDFKIVLAMSKQQNEKRLTRNKKYNSALYDTKEIPFIVVPLPLDCQLAPSQCPIAFQKFRQQNKKVSCRKLSSLE